MKNIFKFAAACLSAVMMLASCSEAEEGLVKVTHYATFELLDADANNVTLVAVGSDYKDAGCICMEGSEDISSKVVVDSDVDTSMMGVYHVVYSATNVDGYASSTTRTVVVYDPTSIDRNIGGPFAVAPGSYRDYSGSVTPFDGYDVDVTYIAPGLYYISDYMGGYYDQRAGYGSAYAMAGYFALNNDNTIKALTADVEGWGDSADAVRGYYDESDGSINLEVDYAGVMTFYVTLAK